jgi:hypothetical protein
LGEWADRLLEHAGVSVTVIDREANVLYYNKWASEHLDRNSNCVGDDVRNRHRRAIINPRFNAMLKLFEDGRTEPVRYVARPYDKTTILVTVSPIFILPGRTCRILANRLTQRRNPRIVRTF